MIIFRRLFPSEFLPAQAGRSGIVTTGLCIGTLTGILAIALASCRGGENRSGAGGGAATTGGTFVVAAAADADALLPPLVASSQGLEIAEQLFEPLASEGDEMNVVGDQGFVPRLADRWEWAPDSLSIVFHLNPKARWHDGVPVTANDVVFSARLYKDTVLSSPAASALDDLDSVTARDSVTAVAWLKARSPRSFYMAASVMLIMPKHIYGKIPVAELRKSDLVRNPVGSGPFKFVRWTPGTAIEIAANPTYYRGRPYLDRVIWTISPGDLNTASARLLSGEADFLEVLLPDVVAKAAQTKDVRVVTYKGIDYAMMLFNERDPQVHTAPHPLFHEAALRRALTMAIDRKSIVQNVFDSLASPAVGPTVRAMPTTDTTLEQIPYDPAAAARLLDSLGWRDPNHTGIRKRGNVALSFTVIAPTSSKYRQQCAVLLQEQLRKVGVQMNIDPMDMGTFLQRERARDFDAALIAFHLGADPSGLRQAWSVQEAHNPNGMNYGSYMNPTFDAQVDSALAVGDPVAARAAFSKAYRTIIADAPAVWLYDLKGVVGVNARFHTALMRSDAWWAHLAKWYIPADQRIARDRITRDSISQDKVGGAQE